MKKNVSFEKINRFFNRIKLPKQLIVLLIGFLSTIWFLVRVIPKPSRASYPCMQAAAPWMSGFILYIAGITSATFAFKRFKSQINKSKYYIAGIFFFIGIVAGIIAISSNQTKTKGAGTYLGETIVENPNEPIGEAKGIFPGRVSWAYNPDATNEDCDPSDYGHTYYTDENTNQDVVDEMLDDILLSITGEKTIQEAWDAIFEYHNNNVRGKGEIGYQKGEKIFIKTNATSSWGGNFNPTTLEDVNNYNYGIAETSPQLVLAVLRNLVYSVGVDQNDIYVGDPMKHIYKYHYDKWSAEFPMVHYIDYSNNTIRESVVKSTTAKITYSDKGTVLREGSWTSALDGDPIYEDYYYTVLEDAEYLINLPTMKGHERAGITMFAKNHFGSHTREDAKHLHAGLVHMGNQVYRDGYKLYRVLVDIMGHEMTGKKNLIYIMDALFSSDYEVDQPEKWLKAPWNNDWTSSLFASLDPVAIESVGYDFLKFNYDGENGYETYAQYYGADDYLHQAADSANWPEGIIYDPEDDGIPLKSLGVHEHWNNPVDMQYSRNLGTGNGIELIKVQQNNWPEIISDFPQNLYVNQGGVDKFVFFAPEHFNDEDGDKLTITIYSDNSNVAVNCLNDSIIIEPNINFLNTALITIKAEDSTKAVYARINLIKNEVGTYNSPFASVAPVLDGNSNDEIWNSASWKALDQVWLPYGATVQADDFTGKFKVVWTADSLYILAEIIDDVLDVNNPNPTQSYWEYDCLEIFVDEDNSGGIHQYSFNAFAYHLSAEGNAIDINTNGQGIILNDNVNIAFKHNGNNTYTWEIAMAMYDDSFDPSSSNTPVELESGKDIGFSVAYCDADNLSNVTRENFFGSVYVTEANQNNHWINADDFGTLVLSGGVAVNHAPAVITGIEDFVIEEINEEADVVNDLNTVFSDSDGDVLTFTAQSSSSALTVNVTANSLSVTANEEFDDAITISVTATDGELSISTTFDVTYDPDVNVNDIIMSEVISVYPNPAYDYVIFELNNDYFGEIAVKVFDFSGRTIKSEIYHKSYFDFNQTINMSDLPKAVYFIEINAGELKTTRLLIIK